MVAPWHVLRKQLWPPVEGQDVQISASRLHEAFDGMEWVLDGAA